MTTPDAPELIWCDIHEMNNCDHLRVPAPRDTARDDAAKVLVSRRGVAHFDSCTHKDDPNYDGWAEIHTPGAWTAIGNGDITTAERADGGVITIKSRCLDCLRDGPLF
jgi:hypothetical protein